MNTWDFAILAVLRPELDAVLARVDDYSVLTAAPPLGAAYSVLIRHRHDGPGVRSSRGIVAPIASMGRVEAAITTTAILDRWKPRYVFLVGMAGGFAAKDVAVGDVIVATEVVDQSLHKVVGKNKTLIREQTYQSDARLLTIAEAMCAAHPPNGTGRAWNGARVHFAPMLSGDRVIASSDFVQDILSEDRRLVGVEMEGAGVLAASKHLEPAPGFLMVRGVADLADEHKSDRWIQPACDAAAGFVIDLLALHGERIFEDG